MTGVFESSFLWIGFNRFFFSKKQMLARRRSQKHLQNDGHDFLKKAYPVVLRFIPRTIKKVHLGTERLARALKIPNFAEKERKQNFPIESKSQKRINEERQRSLY